MKGVPCGPGGRCTKCARCGRSSPGGRCAADGRRKTDARWGRHDPGGHRTRDARCGPGGRCTTDARCDPGGHRRRDAQDGHRKTDAPCGRRDRDGHQRRDGRRRTGGRRAAGRPASRAASSSGDGRCFRGVRHRRHVHGTACGRSTRQPTGWSAGCGRSTTSASCQRHLRRDVCRGSRGPVRRPSLRRQGRQTAWGQTY